MLTARVLNSINEIDEQVWDSIVEKDHLIASYRFLRAVEESGINVCFYKYIVVDDGDKPAAHTCVYKMYFELDVLARGMVKRIANRIRRFWPGFLRLAFLECGTPVALGNTISYAPDADRRKALDVIVNKMEEIAKESRSSILILRDFYNEDKCFYDSLKNYGFKRISNLPNAILENRWQSFEEYLQTMRRNYRYKTKQRIKKAEKDAVRMEIYDTFSAYAETLRALWKNVYEHAKEYRREILTADYFRNMDKNLGSKSRVIVLKKDDNILGFAIVVIDDYTLRPMYIGLDYKYNKENFIFFNLLYSFVTLGIKEKKKMIELGITTIVPKLELGAKIKRMYLYMKHRKAILNGLVTFFFSLMVPPVSFADRNVFKEGELSS